MDRPTLPVLPLFSTLHSGAERLVPAVVGAFAEEGKVELVPRGEEEIQGEPVPVLLVVTGGTEGRALELLARSGRAVVLLSHPGHNALPAALEIAAWLRGEGRAVRLVHLGAGSEDLPVLARAIALARALRGKRVGLVGEPSPWLVASSPDPALLREKLGLEVIPIPLDEVLRRVPAAAPPVEGEGAGIGEEERGVGARVYVALRKLVEEQELDALSIACFGLLPHRLTACWALACLADAGIPAGCEGDLPSLLALMVAQELTGGPGFLANPADLDLKGETLTLAHCTVPLALTRSHVLRTHFESGRGLAVAGEVKPGPYTLVRFGGKELNQGFFVEGRVLDERVGREDLCRTQVRFKLPRGALERLLREPLGNHHVLIPGHHRAVLRVLAELCLNSRT
ncbi:MAG: hypothetical protein N2320_03965 [Candidatus Bipolaricaulota bacterium]|nr:hypothetical protein [Candidatus Bipolaricaulota bacterium]